MVFGLVRSSDDKHFISCSADSTIKVFSMQKMEAEFAFQLKPNCEYVSS